MTSSSSCASLIVRASAGQRRGRALRRRRRVRSRRGIRKITDLGGDQFSVDVLPGSSGPATVTAFGFPVVIGADDAPFIVSLVAPPDTQLKKGPKEGDAVAATTASFRVSSPGEPHATFECSLDGAGWSPCPRVVALSGLADGAHSFAARAVANGAVDLTPAIRSWTVDTVSPSIVVTSPTEGATYAKKQVVVPELHVHRPGWEWREEVQGAGHRRDAVDGRQGLRGEGDRRSGQRQRNHDPLHGRQLKRTRWAAPRPSTGHALADGTARFESFLGFSFLNPRG